MSDEEKTDPGFTIDALVDAFLAEETAPDRTSFTTTSDLIAAARRWAEDKGVYTFGAQALAKRMPHKGYLRWSTGQKRGWRGVRLK